MKKVKDVRMLHEKLTEVILKSYYKVYNTSGYGFLEKVYENAMLIELKKQGRKKADLY